MCTKNTDQNIWLSLFFLPLFWKSIYSEFHVGMTGLSQGEKNIERLSLCYQYTYSWLSYIYKEILSFEENQLRQSLNVADFISWCIFLSSSKNEHLKRWHTSKGILTVEEITTIPVPCSNSCRGEEIYQVLLKAELGRLYIHNIQFRFILPNIKRMNIFAWMVLEGKVPIELPNPLIHVISSNSQYIKQES